MKKNTVKMFVLAMMLGGGISAFAQTPEQKAELLKRSNVEALEILSQRFKTYYTAKQEEAFRLAEINNWPTRLEKEDRGISLLVEVDDNGQPVYLSTSNAGSAITSRANQLHPGGASGLNLTGEGMFVGVWDGNYPLTTHQDFAGRFNSFDGPPTRVALHPTHVLGTVIGAGIGDARARGIAYQAFAYVGDFNNDMTEMTDLSGSIILSNHSYGIGNASQAVRGSYIQQSKDVDDITFFAPYYQPVFAGGNDGNGTYDRLTDRGVSKNGITVAAVIEYNHVGAGPRIASFSSWGPTNDNRIKPDISAKGQDVYSTTNGSDTSYGELDGTSMAAPGVTGALVLVQQHFSRLNGFFMASSTLRGLVAHSADEAGQSAGPDPIFGWGLLNVQKAAEIISKRGVQSVMVERNLAQGETYTLEVPALGSEPLIATLSWTDPSYKGSLNGGSARVLVNDLDIKVVKNNVTTFPWKFNTSPSAAAIKGDNSVDNIEKVEVNNAVGTYTISVSHKGTLSNPDAFGNEGERLQYFSLIVSGIDASNVASVDKVKTSSFSVWPNPANDILNVSIESGIENDANAVIYDMQGRLVLQSKLTGASNAIDINGLTTGVYFVNVTNGGKNEVIKVIVK